MNAIILYGSKYGSTQRYADRLSEETGIQAVSYREAPALSDKGVIVYLGALYAGGVLGLAKTLRGFTLGDCQKLFIATVGLADPLEEGNRENIRKALKKQISDKLWQQAGIYHLRGGIDYQRLSLGHRAAMALLCQTLRRKPEAQWSEEDRALVETYGKQVDFTEFSMLEPLIQDIRAAAGWQSARVRR